MDAASEGPPEYITSQGTLSALAKLSTSTMRRQAEARILALAGQRRCKGEVKALLKAVYQDFVQRRLEQGANTTAFTSLPDPLEEQLKCGQYVADDAGIRYRQIKDDGDTDTVRVCYHPLAPTEYYENIEDGTHKVRLAYCTEGTWKSVVVDRTTIATRQNITALAQYGIDVTSETARYVVQYLADIEAQNPHPRIPRRRSISRMGWIGNDFAPYLADVKYDGQDGYRSLYDSIAPAGDYEAWMACIREARKRDGHFRIQLAASFAAPVLGRLKALPFFCHLWGGAGAGKTVCLMACASVWGDPDAGRYMRTLNGTGAGTEAMAAFLCNLPLCLNELQTSPDRRDMDAVIYMLCEGQGKARSMRGGGLRDAGRWCTTILTNGEQPITTGVSGAGAILRTINLECDGAMFANPRALADALRMNYGHAGRGFVGRLRGISTDDLRARYAACADEIRAAGGTEDKQVYSAAYLLLADRLATEWIFQDGRGLTPEEVAKVLVERSEVDAAARALEFVRGWITANMFRFDDGRPGTEVWGKTMDDGAIAVIPSYLRTALIEAGFSYEAFLSGAERLGVLIGARDGKRQKLVKYGSTPLRCVVLAMHPGAEQRMVTP